MPTPTPTPSTPIYPNPTPLPVPKPTPTPVYNTQPQEDEGVYTKPGTGPFGYVAPTPASDAAQNGVGAEVGVGTILNGVGAEVGVGPAQSAYSSIPTSGGPAPSAPTQNPAAYAAQQNLFNAQQAYIDAQRAEIGQGNQVNAAAAATLNARVSANQANMSYINEQTRFNQMQMANEQKIQTAKGNTADILAITQAQRANQNYSYRYRIAGLNTPIEVILPPGFTGPLPPGMVAKLETQAEILQRISQDEEAKAKFNVEAARLAAAALGVEVTAADIAEGRVRLTLDQVEDATKNAGLNVSQAALEAQKAGVGPPNTVWNQYAGAWTSSDQLAIDTRAHNTALDQQYEDAWGGISVESIMEIYINSNVVPGAAKMSEAELRAALSAHKELSPAQVEIRIRQAQLRVQAAQADDGGLSPEEQALIAEANRI